MSEIAPKPESQAARCISKANLDRLEDALILLDQEWRVTFVNSAAERLTDTQADKLVDQVLWHAAIPFLSTEEFQDRCRRAVSDQQSQNFEEYDRTTGRWLKKYLFPSEEGLLIQIREISSRKQMEIALEEKESWCSTLVNSVGGIIWVADAKTLQFSFVSKQAEQILGYPVARWLKEPDFLRNHIHPDDIEQYTRVCMDASAHLQDCDFAFRMIAADGHIVWLRNIARAEIEDGIMRLRGIMLAITEQKEVEERLLHTEEQFRSLVENAWDVCAMVTEDAKILYVSPSIERMIGYTPEELIGRQGLEWIHPEDVETCMKFLKTLITENQFDARAEYRCRHKNGSWHTVESTGKRFVDERGRVVAVVNTRDITGRSRMEQQLRESESRFRLLFEKNGAGMAIVGVDFKFLQANPAFCKMLGYSEHELLGKTVIDITHPDDVEETRRGFNTVVKGDSMVIELEKRCFRKNGEILWTHSSAVFVSSEGRPTYCIATIQDITERKIAADALRVSEERYRSLVLASAQIVWITNASGEAVPGQPTWTALTGQSEEEVLGWGWLDAVHPEDRPRVSRAWISAIKNKAYYQCEFRIRTAHGDYRDFAVRGVSVCNANGEIREWVGTCTDITEQKRAAADILKWKNRYEAAIQASGQLLYDWDSSSSHVTYGGNLTGLLGYSNEEMTGDLHRWIELIHPDDRDAFKQEIKRVQQTHEPFHLEYRVRRKDGVYIVVNDDGRFYRYPNGTSCCMIGFVSDITERQNTLLQLARAKEAAEAANRAKDDFLAALSHELRTPLNPVLMLTSELENSAEISDSIRQDFAMIRKNVELEARIIDDLLDLTRITRGKVKLNPRPVDAHTLVQQAVEVVRREVEGKQQNLALDLSAHNRRIYADGVRLQQVFWNILKNAVRFTPSHGTISVRSCDTPDHTLLLEFSDTGIGIPKEDRVHIFDAFVQGSSREHQFGGLGLGLTISKRIIELHNGRIWAESPGRGFGSTFYVELPLTLGATSKEEVQPPKEAKSPRSALGTRILLIEDHEPTRLTLARLLTRHGYQVSCADSVATARDLAAHDKFDLVTSDIGLPDGSGHELMSELHKQYGLTGIALSGYGMEEDIQRSLASGFAMHLTKPVDMESLQRAISSLEKTTHSVR